MSKLPNAAPIPMILSPLLVLGAVVILLLILPRTRKRPPDDRWKGIFYANPDDPAVWVPKRSGYGYTLNFGNPRSWGVLALLLGLSAAPFLWLVATRLLHRR